MISLKERVVNLKRLTETREECKKRIFNFYKGKLEELANSNNEIDFYICESICRFPKIDVCEMTVNLLAEGYKILFENSQRNRVVKR